MSIPHFDKLTLIEQVRYMEAAQPLAGDTETDSMDVAAHSDFDARLWQRARRLVERNALQSSLDHAARLTHLANTVALLVAALLGALATVYALTGSETVNIYWLLLVLLGFNLLSMLLWLAGIGLNLEGLIGGGLARVTRWLPDRVAHDSHHIAAADRAWLACNFRGNVGKWRLSGITHRLWLTYLLAGLGILVLVLMTRQYDFVWGTTLLSDAAFVKLTEVLSAPLQALGLTTPTPEQVAQSRVGAAQALTAAHRNSWAQFLLGALLCYGVVPRLLLWGLSLLMLDTARQRRSLDYYLPYYVHLRQRLMPLAGHGQIVDADTSPPEDSEMQPARLMPHPLPAETHWTGVELGEHIDWPPASVDTEHDLGQIADSESLTRIRQRLRSAPCSVLAIAVTAARTPDRGLQRTICELISGGKQVWLVLLQGRGQAAIPAKRLAAWYRLARACKVPAENVISLNVN